MVFGLWLRYPRSLENASFGVTSVCAYLLSAFTVLFTHVYFILLLLPFRATFTEPQCKHLNFPSINQNLRRESFDVFMRNQVEAQAFPFFQGKNERVADIVNITFEETINELCDSLVSQLSEASEELLGHFKSGLPKKASSYRKECSDYVDQLVSNDTGVQRKLVEDVKATYCLKMSDMLGPIMKQFMDLTSEKWEKSYREVLNQALEEFHSEEAEIVCQLFEDVRKETLMYHAQVYPLSEQQYLKNAGWLILILFIHDVLFFLLFHRSKAHAIIFRCASTLYYLEIWSTLFLLWWAIVKYGNYGATLPCFYYAVYLFAATSFYHVISSML